MDNNFEGMAIDSKLGFLMSTKCKFVTFFELIFNKAIDDIGFTNVFDSLNKKIFYQYDVIIGSVYFAWHNRDRLDSNDYLINLNI